jgi:hypothetical protein
MALKCGFRFWIISSLGVCASDAYNLPMVEYQMELLCEGPPVRATMMMR